MNNYYAKKIKNNLKFKKKCFRNLIKLEKFKLIFLAKWSHFKKTKLDSEFFLIVNLKTLTDKKLIILPIIILSLKHFLRKRLI